ncbi:MAG TPA: 23S rRNA (uracil(1939)-C(5))-methyltransferase RlmD [Clostridiales bacterium UBA8960]|nr:23S rRNA (uracil(1939)-C(5))-methyltransferase RlmD [Clostridiales bacterium UBA8960]
MKDELKENQIEILIEDIGDDGEGIGRHEGMTVFVEGALPGDRVLCTIDKQKKNFAKAKVDQIIAFSKERVKAPCPVYSLCGGCQIQDLSYSAQLKLKENMVINTLKRVGHISDVVVSPIIGMKDAFRYRNKGTYPVQGTHEQPMIGFYKKHSHSVVDVKDCLLQDAKNEAIIATIRKYMKDFKVSPFNPKRGDGVIKNIMIRKSDATGEFMVVIVTNGRKLAMTKTLVNLLTAAEPKIVSIIQNIHSGQSVKGLGDEMKLLYGKETIRDAIGGLWFDISSRSFYQVNAKQTEILYSKVLEFANLSGEENVVELYSGTGTISMFLAKKAKHVYGIEIVGDAIEDANKNAAVNQIENVSFIMGNAEEEIEKLYSEGHEADVIVVDPPRAGCDSKVIETMLKLAPKRIVYVSCKPSTLARDLKMLCDAGDYVIENVQPIDVFGHTVHVETVVSLSKVK